VDSSQEQKRLRQQRKLQHETVNVDDELEHISRLYPDTRQTIDRTRDLLGRYSHSINGVVDVREFCGAPKNDATRRMDEVIA
jgi:predicted  nucleic acid-binding Zn-ribbon protein